MPTLVLTTPTCEELPREARKALCEDKPQVGGFAVLAPTAGPPAWIQLATSGDKQLAIAVYVDDHRPIDGPYLETRATWTKNVTLPTATDPMFLADDKVGAFLKALGPVEDIVDARFRLQLLADMNGGSGAIPSIVFASTPTLCDKPAEKERCGVEPDPTAPGAYVARALYVDSMSCECTRMWTKTYVSTWHLAQDGTYTRDPDRIVACDPYPESARKEICEGL